MIVLVHLPSECARILYHFSMYSDEGLGTRLCYLFNVNGPSSTFSQLVSAQNTTIILALCRSPMLRAPRLARTTYALSAGSERTK